MKAMISLIVLIVAAFATVSDARIFFVGSNPYLSFIAYPQDVALFQGEFINGQLWYQQLPWWGDVDEPANKPNDTYTSTGETIMPQKDSLGNQATFTQNGAIHNEGLTVGLCRTLSGKIKMYTTLDYNLNYMRNTASGHLVGASTVDVDYEADHLLNTLYLQPILAFELFGVPMGVKLGAGFDNTLALNHHMNLTIDGVRYGLNKLAWGWSTRHCSNIFGVPAGTSLQGDAFSQDEYATGPLAHFDLQVGATLPKVKLGGRLRLLAGSQDQYGWQGDSSADPRTTTFDGDYVKNQWAKNTSDRILRLYGNVNWAKGDNYALNTLIFLGYEYFELTNALAADASVLSNSRDLSRNLVIEFNPNINIFPARWSYIDAALLLEYSYKRYENRQDRWVNGGMTDAFQGSGVYIGDEYSWENYSYANENFFDAGIDMSIMLPLYGDAQRSVALGLITFLNTKFSWMTKYYGDYPANTTAFSVADLRKDFKREIWFNSMITLALRQTPFSYRLELTEPLLYSLSPETRVTTADGATVLYEHDKAGPFASQQGVKVALWVSRDITDDLFKKSLPPSRK